MKHVTKKWFEATALHPTIADVSFKQAYVWFVTDDNKILIVSKDGISWQLPGGKPTLNEPPQDTAAREQKKKPA